MHLVEDGDAGAPAGDLGGKRVRTRKSVTNGVAQRRTGMRRPRRVRKPVAIVAEGGMMKLQHRVKRTDDEADLVSVAP